MRKIVCIAVFLISLPMFGQRFAYVDSEYILNLLPSYKSAQKELDFLSQQWEKEIEKNKEELVKLEKNLAAERILLTEDVIKQREGDITKKQKELREYQIDKFGVDGELFKKRQELIKPIQDKVFEAIQKVAKDNALDFILDKSGSVTMLYTNARYDRSDEVLEELGISTTGEGAGQTPEEETDEE